MSINLDEATEYKLLVGASLRGSGRRGDGSDSGSSSGGEEDGFHLVSRHLPRTSTKATRETLESGANMRVRLPAAHGPSSSSGGGKGSLLLEADVPDQKATCTYEGEVEHVADQADGADDEVACVLIYDDELKAFTIEKLASTAAVTSGLLSQVAATGTGATASMLALPASAHGSSGAAGARRESESVMDEALEDELAKELEGMLDDDSDGGEGAGAGGGRANRQGSARAQGARVGSEELLTADLERSLGDALFSPADSEAEADDDDDEFEAIDGAKAPGGHSDKGSAADDDEMAFEEIDLPTSLGAQPGGSLMEDDSDQFEDVSASRIPSIGDKGAADDDGLFVESFTTSPVGYAGQGQQGADTLDEFEELDLDLSRSLASS
ncbi:hypothetical protein IWQ57_003785 [Coemansia nantahalensis]|uniref:Uncharacterized protein n=1 Tax=Coemansia nantahalensis TaxID=2789366 RepID=A0ACC1JVD0_9FUNG|nr:hypothetical protein IWQ57_003785 [Coemansia nantahalensis]